VTAATSALRALASADLDGWAGLPPDLTVDDAAAELAVAADVAGVARLGDAGIAVEWLAVESDRYAGGLRVYFDRERVLVVEGLDPVTAAGGGLPAPELGEPELALEVLVGALGLDGVEHVHADRGLAVRLGPGGDGLRGVLGFAPTTADDYVDRLRPRQVPRRPFRRDPELPS
jgi:hypothetical protein